MASPAVASSSCAATHSNGSSCSCSCNSSVGFKFSSENTGGGSNVRTNNRNGCCRTTSFNNDRGFCDTLHLLKHTTISSTTTTNNNNNSNSAISKNETKINCSNKGSRKSATPTTSSTSSSGGYGGAGDGNRNFYEFLCIVVTCALCYYNSTQCGLVFDDISAIRDNKDLRPNTPWRNIFLNDFWGTPMRKEQSHKSYRPFTVFTFRLNYWWHELEPHGYHLVNVLLHAVVCILWRRVCRVLLWQCYAGASVQHQQSTISCSNNNQNNNSGSYASQVVQRKILALNRCSFLAALIFAVHPVHTEAVTGVVGRAELLSSIWYLLAFLSYTSCITTAESSSSSAVRRRISSIAPMSTTATKTRWSVLSVQFVGCLLTSMLCKEQGITIAAICAAYEMFVVQQLRPVQLWQLLQQLFDETPQTPSKDNGITSGGGSAKPTHHQQHFHQRITFAHGLHQLWHSSLAKRLIFVSCVTALLLVARVHVMGSQLPVFTRFDNPASAAAAPARHLTYSYLVYLNMRLLVLPNDLCCDWTMGTIPLLEHFTDSRNVLTLLTFVGVGAVVTRACLARCTAHERTLLMCVAWLVLPFVPASNLFFPVGFVVAERVLYMPSMGFCLLIAYGYTQLQEHMSHMAVAGRWLLKCGVALLLVTYALKTHVRNWDWRTEYSLFMSGVHVNARNAKLFNNVGHALENEARFEEALAYFQEAVRIQNDDIGAHINVGRTYNNLKRYDEAEVAYRRAKALFPQIKPGESYQARIAPSHLNVFINLANLIAKNQTRLEEADQLYRQAISMRSDYVQAYINRGDILMKLNRTAQAQEVYEQALLYDSDNADIYYNLGVVALEQGKSAQAHAYFNKAIELYPEHEQALLNSAILLQELGAADARQLARERLYKVLLHDANNEKVYFNLGMLAMDDGNFDEAEQYFKRAIHLKANFRSALFNLALMLADASRPLDAVPYLNQLIRYHADHIKGLILLGDIYINHMKDLDAAEVCYRKILKYEPHNVQGLHNLCVVFVERKAMARANACLRYVLLLAPSEEYIQRHLEIVQTRLSKLAKMPAQSIERVEAFRDYDPNEFPMPSTASQTATVAHNHTQQQNQKKQQQHS